MMTEEQIYRTAFYKKFASEIEELHKELKRKMELLEIAFPTQGGKAWIVMGNHRPYIRTLSEE